MTSGKLRMPRDSIPVTTLGVCPGRFHVLGTVWDFGRAESLRAIRLRSNQWRLEEPKYRPPPLPRKSPCRLTSTWACTPPGSIRVSKVTSIVSTSREESRSLTSGRLPPTYVETVHLGQHDPGAVVRPRQVRRRVPAARFEAAGCVERPPEQEVAALVGLQPRRRAEESILSFRSFRFGPVSLDLLGVGLVCIRGAVRLTPEGAVALPEA